jgi:hypothetical protein
MSGKPPLRSVDSSIRRLVDVSRSARNAAPPGLIRRAVVRRAV